jgi:hypothetical protein
MPQTHEALNEGIGRGTYPGVFNLDEFLRVKLGFVGGVLEPIPGYTRVWERLTLGGSAEDLKPFSFVRSFNHFHDPLARNWSLAGFNFETSSKPPARRGSQPIPPGGNRHYDTSSAVWAQSPDQGMFYGRYSWPAAREYFFKALTAGSESDRNKNYAECFRALGQVMHLVQDASVPSHARNDAHVFYEYERFIERMSQGDRHFLDDLAKEPVPVRCSDLTKDVGRDPAATVPIAGLFDRDVYDGRNPEVTTGPDVGLAEYTNANFFSEDTVASSYPFPVLFDSTIVIDKAIPSPRDSSLEVTRKYFVKSGRGESGYLLAGAGYLSDYLGAPEVFKHYLLLSFPEHAELIESRNFDTAAQWVAEMARLLGVPSLEGLDFLPMMVVDDYCYTGYARKLIPRAAAYSAEIPRYFFRGDIDALEVTEEKALLGTLEEESITGITLKVKNRTPGESMSSPAGCSSSLTVSCRYRLPGAAGYTYGSSAAVPLRATIQPDNDTSSDSAAYAFAFNVPFPASATGIEYTLVYRGRLGAEDDAVAARVFRPQQASNLFVGLDVVDETGTVVGMIIKPVDALSPYDEWDYVDKESSVLAVDGAKVIPSPALYAGIPGSTGNSGPLQVRPLFKEYDEVLPSNLESGDVTVAEDHPGTPWSWGVRVPIDESTLRSGVYPAGRVIAGGGAPFAGDEFLGVSYRVEYPGPTYRWEVREYPGIGPAPADPFSEVMVIGSARGRDGETVTRTFTVECLGAPLLSRQWQFASYGVTGFPLLSGTWPGSGYAGSFYSLRGEWVNMDYALIPLEFPRTIGAIGKAVSRDRYGMLLVSNEYNTADTEGSAAWGIGESTAKARVIFRGTVYELESAPAVSRLYGETTYASENKSKYYQLPTGDRYLYFYSTVEYSSGESHEATVHAHAVGLAGDRENQVYRFADIEPWGDEYGGPSVWPSRGNPDREAPHGLARIQVPGRGTVFISPNSERLIARR